MWARGSGDRKMKSMRADDERPVGDGRGMVEGSEDCSSASVRVSDGYEVAAEAEKAGEDGLLSAADERKSGVSEVAEDGVVGLDSGAPESGVPAVDGDWGNG